MALNTAPATNLDALRLIDGGAALEVDLNGDPRRFHAIWLRDNAPDPETRDPRNGQKRIGPAQIPAATRIVEARWTEDGLRVVFAPEGKAVTYDPAWLAAHAYDRVAARPPGWTAPDLDVWDASLSAGLTTDTFTALRDDRTARRRWLAAIARQGVARISGAPTDDGAVCAIAGLFGSVRETNYGRWFDVRATVDPNNLADTSLGLAPHTDNPYRDPVPTLQILLCVETAVAGGESVVVDGFAVAERLRAESPEGFACLAGHVARFAYRGSADVSLSARRPILELAPDGELIAVRFNPRSAAALTDIPYESMASYYAAYRRFAELTEGPALAVRFTLAPGEGFVVDNTRVLHGRTAFTGGGKRRLQGCYADKDGLLSALRVLEAGDGQGPGEDGR